MRESRPGQFFKNPLDIYDNIYYNRVIKGKEKET